MFKSYLSITLFLLFAGLVVPAALAQQTNDRQSTEIYIGYHLKGTDGDKFNGAAASVTGNFHNFIGAEFEFGVSKGPDRGILGRLTDYDYLGGIRVKDNRKNEVKVKPFAHFLAGINQVDNLGAKYNSFTTVIGGGIDVRVSERISVRAIKGEYQHVYDVSYGSDQYRVGFGLVFH